MVKIYTKIGDKGFTSMIGGKKIPKDELLPYSVGIIDDLSVFISKILTENPPNEINKKLERIQEELFTLSADLATPLNTNIKIPRIRRANVSRLEKEIDLMEKSLKELKNFIFPRGDKTVSKFIKPRNLYTSSVSISNAENSVKLKNKFYYEIIKTDKNKVGTMLFEIRTFTRDIERVFVSLNRLEKLNSQILSYINRLSDWFFITARFSNKLEGISERIWKGRG